MSSEKRCKKTLVTFGNKLSGKKKKEKDKWSNPKVVLATSGARHFEEAMASHGGVDAAISYIC